MRARNLTAIAMGLLNNANFLKSNGWGHFQTLSSTGETTRGFYTGVTSGRAETSQGGDAASSEPKPEYKGS